SKIEGFFLNATHFDWTSREIAYGEQVARLTGGKHFVINTGSGGRGPLAPADPVHQGNEVLCNPPGRGLGPKPTTAPGYRNVDAFAWMMDPGESGGQCVPGAPPTGDYWAEYGLMLIHNAGYSVDNAVNVSQWGTTAAARATRAHGKAHHKKPKAHKPVRKHPKRKHATRTHARRTPVQRVYAHIA
ncbi:MAG: endoglucanase, partial [Solirubrobacteraceae bacterium]|nr:endoglucanase [Solirubrobacteraceae bacterium]